MSSGGFLLENYELLALLRILYAGASTRPSAVKAEEAHPWPPRLLAAAKLCSSSRICRQRLQRSTNERRENLSSSAHSQFNDACLLINIKNVKKLPLFDGQVRQTLCYRGCQFCSKTCFCSSLKRRLKMRIAHCVKIPQNSSFSFLNIGIFVQ